MYNTQGDAPEAMRIEALQVLSVWPRPSVLDRVDGWHRGPLERDPEIARQAMASVVASILQDSTRSAVKIAAVEAVGKLRVEAIGPVLSSIVQASQGVDLRIAALNALQQIGSPLLEEAVRAALGDSNSNIRRAALRLAPTLAGAGDTLADMLARVVETGSVDEQQTALEALARLDKDPSRAALKHLLDQLAAGELAPEIQLDLLEAVEGSADELLTETLARYRASMAEAGPLAAYAEAIYGGSINQGRRLFQSHPSASCTQCHSIGERGGNAGPDLTKIGAVLTREMLLQALIDPSARIAPGYGIVALTLNSGDRVIGTLMEETDAYLDIEVGGEKRRLNLVEISVRDDVPSSMPSMQSALTKRELRDIVAYLSSLR